VTAALNGADRTEQARQLYGEGLSLRQVAARMGIAHTTVRTLLLTGRTEPRRPHLRAVQDLPSRAESRKLQVPPERAAIAFTADRGWHMVQAPPGWFLDLLAEVD
jgi:hypothetical protein